MSHDITGLQAEVFRKAVEEAIFDAAGLGYDLQRLNVKAGLVVNGFSITFMRIKGNALDPSDLYSSTWIGDKTGGSGPT